MADDRSHGAKRSWRGKAEPDRPERPVRTEKSSYKWTDRGTKPGAGGRPTGSHRVRLFAGLAAFTTCLGVVVWLIWMLNSTRPAGVVLLGADYAKNLAVPHNALGYRGLKGIEDLSRAPTRWTLFKPARLELIRDPGGRNVLETADDWAGRIAALKKGFGEPTLILVLALHGGSDSGGAYLMPNQFKRPEDRLDMRAVIASMKELPPEKAKVLVVEGSQVESDWRLGMLHNDFARRLKELEPEIRAVPNLWVLSGCDEDQRCWASEGLGRTIFHYYITEALRGGSAAGTDGRLSLEELYRYVRENVRGWAWTARGAVQEPILIPDLAPSAEASPPLERDALTDAWLGFRRLDAMVPHPSAYSPLRWRAYGATLVRYEQLLLAGSAEAAQPVGEQLSQLKQAIAKDRMLIGLSASAGVNLVMDALNGEIKDVTAPTEFEKILQSADDPAVQKSWDTLRTGEAVVVDDGRGPARPLRSRLAEFLLRRAREDQGKYLERAADRIRLTALAVDPLPAESHFLRMLLSLSPPLEGRPPSFRGLAANAPRVRVLAERAAMGVSPRANGYAYTEQVHAWTRLLVERADDRRRTGEDQLFAADERTWDLARKDLEAAEDGYRQALDQAVAIRTARSARDRAFAALPEYSRWLVHHHSDQPGDDPAGRVETLWTKAHQLSRILEKPEESTEAATIVQTAQDLNAGLDKLVEQFVQERGRIAKDRLRQDWEDDRAAAAVLFPDDESLTIRKRIWDRLDDIRLHDVEVARSPAPAPGGADRPDPGRVAEAARRRAAIQGTLALAALGETWFANPDFKDLDQGDYGKTRERLGALATRTDDANPWWKESAALGDRIGRRFRALRGKIAALADEGRGITDFAEFQSRLSEADGLARRVDRGDDPPAVETVEPASRYRQARVHDFLVWMARRAWLDHWYGEKPTAPPYYQAIVARLFDDAQGFFPDLREADRKERERLSAPGRLALTGPDQGRLVVTSELEASAEYRVVEETGPPTVPPGIPVVRPRLIGPLDLVPPSTADYRAAARGSQAATAFRLASPNVRLAERRGDGFAPLLGNPGGRAASLNVEGFFRGQNFKLATPVDLQVVPDTVAIGPAPPDRLASVAVRASDEIIRRFGMGTGSIAVVLDCSGSMNEGIVGGTKWTAAKQALLQVLQEVPQNTKLSVWTFSQARPGVLFNAKGEMAGNNEEQNRQAVLDSEAPERTIKPQRPLSPWAPGQLAQVQRLLEELHPYHETPLAQAMADAATSLADVPGLKNLLVLTDGNDNRFKGDIPAFLEKTLRPLGLRVTIVYFHAGEKAKADELLAARNNFEAPIQRLDPRNRFVQAGDLGQLITRLRAGLEQKLICQVMNLDNTPAGDESLEVRPRNEPLRWWTAGLEPRFYTLFVLADKPYLQKVNLESGDRLIVDLVDDNNGGIAFRRALYGDEDEFQAEEKRPGGRWRLTTLGDQKTGDDPAGLGLMAAIESTTTDDSTLVQRRPGWADFQLGVAGVKEVPSALAVRYRERMAYPAPVWQLDVPRWTGQLGRPVLTAWWLDKSDTATTAAFDFDPAGVPSDFKLADGGLVRVEGFGREDHYVEVQPGEPPQLQPCLVIRLAYPMGSPHCVDPDSLKVVGPTRYEHRYYHRAGKYAGLFWLVNDSQFEILRKSKFRVVSLNRLRSEAEKHGQTVKIQLGAPRDDKLPEPPQAIRK
jgi:hypothetical protein